MALHIFGDSFFEDWPGSKNSWQVQLGKLLNTNVVYHGLAGSAVDYTIKQYYKALPQFTNDDYIIVGITNHQRIYSPLQEKDGCAAALMMSDSEAARTYGAGWKDAIQVGVTWFMDDDVNMAHIHSFLHAVSNTTRGLRTPLIIQCFGYKPFNYQLLESATHINIAHGDLYTPCKGEFMSSTDIVMHQSTPVDTRPNHFSPANHTVLATKINNHFAHNQPLDLTTDFIANIVTL